MTHPNPCSRPHPHPHSTSPPLPFACKREHEPSTHPLLSCSHCVPLSVITHLPLPQCPFECHCSSPAPILSFQAWSLENNFKRIQLEIPSVHPLFYSLFFLLSPCHSSQSSTVLTHTSTSSVASLSASLWLPLPLCLIPLPL